jgi:hypothetical protein
MANPLDWKEVATFGAIHEAELASGRLQASGIPSRIDRRGAIGLFGAGFSGDSVRGIALLVPSTYLTEAREALDLDEARPT